MLLAVRSAARASQRRHEGLLAWSKSLIISYFTLSPARTRVRIPCATSAPCILCLEQVKGLTRTLQYGVAELCVSHPDFAKEVQVGRHYNARAQVNGRREIRFVGEIVGEQSHGDLTLPVGLLVD